MKNIHKDEKFQWQIIQVLSGLLRYVWNLDSRFLKERCLTCLHLAIMWDFGFKYELSDSTVVEHRPHHSKVEGLSPAAAAGTGRENGENEVYNLELR